MANMLPIKLAKEPLFDAIFELRFTSEMPASSILPGYLFSKLKGEKKIERLPAADLPKQLRDADPNLQFAPMVRIHWNNFLILISDRSVALACKMPYQGWLVFKQAIIDIMNELKQADMIKTIQRYSLKYVDLIQSDKIDEQVSFINFDVKLGNHRLEKDNFQLRMEISRDNHIAAINIVSSATITTIEGETKSGVIVDIDVINNLGDFTQDRFMQTLAENLEHTHSINKELFFDCLKPETISMLEPIYAE